MFCFDKLWVRHYNVNFSLTRAQWNITIFPSFSWIRRVTPHSAVDPQSGITAVVLCSCTTPVREVRVRIDGRSVRWIRGPCLTLLASLGDTHSAGVFTPRYRLSAVWTDIRNSVVNFVACGPRGRVLQLPSEAWRFEQLTTVITVT